MKGLKIGHDGLTLGRRIGRGGEGEVFLVEQRPNLAVKIYNFDLRGTRELKIRAMVQGGLAGTTDLVAYPSNVVRGSDEAFVGFSMRLVSSYRPIHELYSPKSRRVHFPAADFRFLIRAARNVASAVGKVHQSGCVIGDLNHSGVLVSADATVALIDADSFQFQHGEHIFPCVVGVPDFTAPELHGANLAIVRRTREHDYFGLAVAIFHLLFMGRHPYAGRYQGPDLSLGEAIAQNRFAFSAVRHHETRTTPPPGALTLVDFPTSLAQAFERAFGLVPHSRPAPAEWVQILSSLEGGLSRCSINLSHYFPSAAGSCVWCRMASTSGLDMFPERIGSTAPLNSGGHFDIETILRELSEIKLPSAHNLLPKPKVAYSGPSPTLQQAQSDRRSRMLIGLGTTCGAVAGFVGIPDLALVWIGVAIFGGTRFFGNELDIGSLNDAFRVADQKVQTELDHFLRRKGVLEWFTLIKDLEEKIVSYKRLDGELLRELERLKASRESRQRNTYLDRFPIRSAGISGIGPAKTSTLISFGIETAADVTEAAVRAVPGFGEVMVGKLLSWRRAREANFRYNPTPDASDVQAEKSVRARFETKKADLETSLRTGAVALRAAKSRLGSLPVEAAADPQLTHAIEARAVTEHDFTVLGVQVPTSAVAIRIPVASAAATFTQNVPRAAGQAPSPLAGSGGTQAGSPSRANAAPRCPACGSAMMRRTARRGRNAGNRFWGCTKYPSCRGTRN